MPPPSPVLVQILQAAAARLAAIEAGADYFHTPKAVWREFRFLDEVNDLPVFLVLPGPEEGEAEAREFGGGESGTGGVIDAIWELEVFAYGQGTESKPVAEVCLELLRDAEHALTTPDWHLGLTADVVESILNTRRSGIPPDIHDPDRRGAMSHLYRVRYLYPQGESE